MIVLGRLVGPYGVRGWLHIHAFGDDPEAWQKMSRWWLSTNAEADDAAWQSRGVETVKRHAGGVVVKLEGVDDRSAAEAMDGYYFGAPREELPPPSDGEYYWSDLIGLSVVNLQGVPLGQVSSLIETGANDVLVVTEGDRERLIPYLDHVVKEVNLSAGTVRVDWEMDW